MAQFMTTWILWLFPTFTVHPQHILKIIILTKLGLGKFEKWQHFQRNFYHFSSKIRKKTKSRFPDFFFKGWGIITIFFQRSVTEEFELFYLQCLLFDLRFKPTLSSDTFDHIYQGSLNLWKIEIIPQWIFEKISFSTNHFFLFQFFKNSIWNYNQNSAKKQTTLTKMVFQSSFNFFCRYLGDPNQDKTLTRRVADAIFNPLSSTIFTIVAIPLVIAAVYWLFVVNGPTPVVKVKLIKLWSQDHLRFFQLSGVP